MAVAGLRKLAGRVRLVLAAVLGLAIWAGVTLLATRPAFRGIYDMSPQAHFSVGPETEELLVNVRAEDRKLGIDTFYTPLMRPATELQAHQFAIIGRIQELTTDLLRMYASLGGEAVEVVYHDVRRDVQKTRARIKELGGLNQENSVVISLGKRHKVLSLLMDMAVIDTPGAQAAVAPGARPTFPSLRMYKGEEAISSTIRSLLVEGQPKLYFLKSGQVSA